MPADRLRLLVWAAAAGLGAFHALAFLPSAYFRFDDFWQINSNIVHPPPLRELLTSPNAADGRWNPGMRGTLALLGGVFGVDGAWPYYLTLVAGHGINVALAVRLARALGAGAHGRFATAFAGIAGVNFSAFTLTSICLLYSVSSTAFVLAGVLAALSYARTGRRGWLGACALWTLCGLLTRENAVVAPALAAVALLSLPPEARPSRRRWAALALAFAAAGAAFAAAHVLAGRPLLPGAGRYALAPGPHVIRNLAMLAAHAGIWLVAPAAGAWRYGDRGAAARALWLGGAWAIAAALPTLLLSWWSPGHLYLALFGVAVSAGRLFETPRQGMPPAVWRAWIGCAAAAVLITGIVAARHDLLRWGPHTRQVLRDWNAQRRPDDRRVIWFEAGLDDDRVGLVRLIGPGIRLRDALEVWSRERLPAGAAICVEPVVGPPYVGQAGDALFLHTDGRLVRIERPPFARASCLP